ncbi:MAG: dienelactone hydrolase family protein [Pigmentiphaga sp.]|uniref:alpha/beta hydrolase n=1 Tax=Pigmentiphaga sp. TaxID=1977564 RepID=UPI0029AC4C42|nr:dienelactone hydrolase family protein [Pigmentiphaga sp.]MDX3906658.1 dienelactone hydrolase family protein [Pigmentiphaga sp.]
MANPLLECVEVETGPQPSRAVIWLHGLGADGHDFEPIVPELDLSGLPPIRFVFPHASVQPVTINGGMAMRAWYDIVAADLVRREDEAGIRTSQRHVEGLIARENQRGIASRHIVLAGFSQGCAMTLHTGLRHPDRLAGLLALSGYLPLATGFAAERHPANAATPIFMGHGTADPIVALDRAAASRDALRQLGYDVEWHAYPMPHSVCAPELADISAFLRKVLA